MTIQPLIVTVTNDLNRSQRLINSAKAYGWNIEVLSIEGPYPGANFKFKAIFDNLDQWRARGFTHLISVDAFDFIVCGTGQTFLGQLHSLNFPRLIIAAETNCYPDKSIEHKFADTKTRWRYVNSPFILDITRPVPDGFADIGDKDDQVHVSEWYLDNRFRDDVVLDSNCRFFQTLYGVDKGIFASDLRNTETGTYPIFFHGNGNADMSFIPVRTESKVMIGVATAGYTRFSQIFDHVSNLQRPPGTQLSFSHGQSPAQTRNALMEDAIKKNCSHILLIDDDVLLPPDALLKLLAHDKDVCVGLYYLRRWPHQPVIFDHTNEEGWARWHMLSKGENGLIPITNAGLGCALIKTSVLEKMEKPWVRIGQLDKSGWGDDIDFFNRMRKESTTDLWCDLTVRAGHVGQLTIWPDTDAEGNWCSVLDTQGAQAVRIPQLTFAQYEAFANKQKAELSK